MEEKKKRRYFSDEFTRQATEENSVTSHQAIGILRKALTKDIKTRVA